MERPSRGRANTFTGAVKSLFSGFKTPRVVPPPANETIGWRPNTLERHTSGLSPHTVHSCKPKLPSKAAPNLKRQLSSGSRKHNNTTIGNIPDVSVVEAMSPGAQSYASGSSPQRVAFVPQLLRPADSSKAGSKLRQRVPSPYPDAKRPPPMADQKPAVYCEPMIRNRTRTLTMERMDGVHSITQYLEAHPDALPPPGSTPAFVEHYWNLQRRHTGDSVLSDPEADDEASDISDAESNTSYSSATSGDIAGSAWDCGTPYDADKDYRVKPAPRQYTPAATRPPLKRHAQTWPRAEKPNHYYSPAQAPIRFPSDNFLDPPGTNPSSTLCGSPRDAGALRSHPSAARTTSYSPSSWLPTDPSAVLTHKLQHPGRDIPVPRLRWDRDVGPDGLWFITSVRPAHGATAGRSEGGGAAGPSHTPRAGYCHVPDPRLGPVDAGELAERLESVVERLELGVSEDDKDQEWRRERYEGWKGVAARTEWMHRDRGEAAGEMSHPALEVGSGAEAEVPGAREDFPDYQEAEDVFAEQGNGAVEIEVVLRTCAPVDSGSRGPARARTTSNLPLSKAHRQRVASKLDVAVPADLDMHLQSTAAA